MGRALFLIIIAIDVIVVFDITRGRRKDITILNWIDNKTKLLWLTIVIFLPILGPILYYVIGKKKEWV